MVERRKGTYAAVKYDTVTCMILGEWCKSIGIIMIDPSKLHSTLIYSRVEIPVENQHNLDEAELRSRGWKFEPSHFELMPTSSDPDAKKEVLVLVLKAPELVELHDELCQNGATHDFDDYIPHVTLSYKVSEHFNVDLIPPQMYFVPNQIYFEQLDLNWKD